MTIMTIVRDLEEQLGIPIEAQIGCDNARSIEVSNGDDPKKKNADIEHEIIFLKNENEGHIEAYYIKTHQDDDSSYNTLPPDVQAQVRCHNRAK